MGGCTISRTNNLDKNALAYDVIRSEWAHDRKSLELGVTLNILLKWPGPPRRGDVAAAHLTSDVEVKGRDA
jgi:hypothetical protein